jgi:hypothetical protein
MTRRVPIAGTHLNMSERCHVRQQGARTVSNIGPREAPFCLSRWIFVVLRVLRVKPARLLTSVNAARTSPRNASTVPGKLRMWSGGEVITHEFHAATIRSGIPFIV